MIVQYHKIALAATFGLAMAFTLSCSSGSDDPPPNGGGTPNGGGKGALFNENSQIYNKDGTRYTGSGIIEASRGIGCGGGAVGPDGSGGGMACTWDHIRAGSVAGGIVNFELNEAVPDNEYLSDYLDDNERHSCTSYPENIKVAGGSFVLTSSNGNPLGRLFASSQNEGIYYCYFSKPGKITCNLQYESVNEIIDFNATNGWNKIYIRAYRKDGVKIREFSTTDILTEEVKWIFTPLLEH